MGGFIPDDIINRVRDSINIVDLVSRYLALKKTGANYKALCPFHKEKTPSFVVSPDRQTFHCFGCGKGGTVFHFLMEMDRVSFPEAVRALAKEAGIEVPDTRPAGPQPDRDDRDALYNANLRAADYFARMLDTTEGRAAREYVQTRGISDEMVKQCRLGYSPDSWDALLSAAGAAGVSEDVLCRAGLAIRRDDRSGCYDRFRNRLMFPIFDTQGRVIGFGARTMADDDVKYINTPETPLFSKGRNLYGLNWARRAIVDARRVAVVEGYTDVIMAHQHGCQTVVATLGTALTRDHIRLLRRFAQRVDVVFDADAAGQRAAERSMDLFLTEGAGEFVAAGFDVRIATIPGGKDPCDLIAQDGPDAFTQTIDAAVDVFKKKIELAGQRHDLSSVEGRSAAIDEVLSLAALIPNDVARELRINQLVARLHNTFGVTDEGIRARLWRLLHQRRQPRTESDRPQPPAEPLDPSERGLLEAVLAAPGLGPEVLERLTAADFESASLRQLFEAMMHQYEQDGTVNAASLLAVLQDPALAAMVSGVASEIQRPDAAAAGRDCLRALLRRRVERKIRQVLAEFEKARASGDEERADHLSLECNKLRMEVQAL